MFEVSFASFRAFATAVLESAGVSPADAVSTADELAVTDAWGVFTHGPKLLAGYLRRLQRGGLRPEGRPRLVAEGGARATIDGDAALGHVAGVMAMRIAMARAAGGPGFVRQPLGPSPHTRILSTGLSDTSPAALASWFKAGVCAVGVGREMMPPELIAAGDWRGITRSTSEYCSRVRQAQATAQHR